MANDKYFDMCEDLESYFTKAFADAGLERVLNLRVLGCKNQKKITDGPKKVPPLYSYMTKEDIVITVNEEIFEMLTDEQKTIVAEETIAAISYDHEKDRASIATPDFQTYGLIIRKYGFETMETLRETIKAFYDQQANSEEGANV
jgi:TRAP-type mannitol/chloroaromatic compound transport system substrate-binding protein